MWQPHAIPVVPVTEHAAPTGARSPIFPAHADKEQAMNAAKPALTPEQRSFLEALFKDDAAFEEDALRVYASDASLRTFGSFLR